MESQNSKTIALLKTIIAEKLGCDANAIDEKSAFFNLGVTSLVSEEIRTALKRYFSDLSETLMFEYPNIKRLSAHLAGKRIAEIDDSVIAGVSVDEAPTDDRAAVGGPVASAQVERSKSGSHGYDIAIVGISGRFPQADNPGELWQNLLNNKDCVVEIPKHRWDYLQRFSTDKRDRQALFSKWGGFINGVEEFDPLFFQISHREAESLDPQQKLFLQCCWELMEDAGYGNPDIRSTDNVGVYVGVTWNEFSVMALEEGVIDNNYRGAGSLYWGIPNRVSYFLDLKGPSIAIDTACSSSLVAVHDACHALLSGECEMAIAGGVNLNLHPAKYLYLSQNHFLSSDGKCRSFGDGGDGYVPGEGVAAVLLKPLPQAQRDGDYIYGVIRGSAVNHGGKVTGYTVPNPNAQRELVVNAIRQAQINPEHISYVECHGTGTELGDPIEIKGLSSAFETFTGKKQFCAIGSIKSNIGHLEAAAGVTGLIKIVQAMQHRCIPGSLHSGAENKKLNLPSTAFYIAKSNLDWQAADGHDRLVASVSSFGAGGSNAHLIVEQHSPQTTAAAADESQIFVLSAQTPRQLRQYADKLRVFIDSIAGQQTHTAASIAYTLMYGRKHFASRLAIIAADLPTLSQKLRQFCDDAVTADDIFHATADGADVAVAIAADGSTQWAQRWVNGSVVPLAAAGRRVPLPTYPFLKERSWIAARTPLAGNKAFDTSGTNARLHPLVDSNSSTLKRQKYRKTFHVGEYVLADHLVNEIHVIPGVCHLEIAAVTGELAAEQKLVSIKDVWFSNVISVDQQRSVEIEFLPKGDTVHYQIKDPAQDILFSRGKLQYATANEAVATPATVDVAGINAMLSDRWNSESVYQLFVRTGIIQKTSFQVIREIGFDQQQCLSKLQLPDNLRADFKQYKLHPALMDGAVQTAMMYVQFLSESEVNILPFHFSEVKQYAPLTETVYVYCRLRDRVNKQFDMNMCNEAGETLVGITGFILKEMKQGHADGETSHIERGTNYAAYYNPDWKRLAVNRADATVDSLLVIGDRPELLAALQAQAGFEQARILQIVNGDQYHADGDRFTIATGSVDDYQRLLKQLKNDKCLPERILVLDAPLDATADIDPQQVDPLLEAGARNLFAFCKALIPLAKQARLVYLSHAGAGYRPAAQALSGLFKTLKVEKPSITASVVHVEDAGSDAELAGITATELLGDDHASDIVYRERQRHVRTFSRALTKSFAVNGDVLRHRGVYLISGGLGAIGLIFARYLCEQYGASVYLTGRSELTAEKQQSLEQLPTGQGSIRYLACDVGRFEAVERLIQSITADGGALHGIIHSAGVIDDAFILKKTPESFANVLRPKVNGTVNLDVASRNLDLDFFVTFSSVTSILGNFGQSDYGYGNAFEDYYAYYRQRRVGQGQRKGKSLSINWPYWQDGGMQLNAKEEEMLTKTFGFAPLSSQRGVQALIDGLQSELTQFAVLPAGDVTRIEQVLGISAKALKANTSETVVARESDSASGDIGRQIETYLKQLFAKELKIPLERIDANTSFDQYGMDSIVMIDLITVMEEKFASLPKTLFFEHQTLAELVRYFEENHAAHFKSSSQQEPVQEAADESEFSSRFSVAEPRDDVAYQVSTAAYRQNLPVKAARNDDDIAIVGLAGRYPQANNLDEFWANLKSARDCISEIPIERWDLAQSFQAGKPVQGKSYGKWGGFLQDADKFDPLFFNISPSEAENMDPAERLFLETVAATIEDAGYTADTLADNRDGVENPVGVFAGVMWGDYQLFGVESDDPAQWLNPRSFYWAVANRVSYFFNFSGPSIAIDTACSSSLTAIHLACDSIRKGECNVAIAGGVNLSLHPNKYNLLSNMQFLSSDGRCRSFGEGGDGYVPGEGVGAVLLKPLQQAVSDGDHVYAVIKGSSVNHGGKTSGFTVPNPKRQTQLIAEALQVSGVNPRHIGYLEAHGTGTSLGDPIEMIGLNKAFAQSDRQYCSIGSLKSNIGHLEAAAGIAGLTKVLLQLKHRTLVPSLHADEINRNIDFSASPFYLQRDLQEWKRLRFLDDSGSEIEIPRMAGISSFGAGGSNAHLIVEEYIEPASPAVEQAASPAATLMLLSAKKPESLQAYAAALKAFCDSPVQYDLHDIAYTLQIGRAHLDYRLAIQCSDRLELSAKLDAYLQGKSDIDGLLSGNRSDNATIGRLLANDSDSKEVIEKWMQKKNYASLASLWVGGVAIDWAALHHGMPRKRVSLPTYPFKRERYWISKPVSARRPSSLHPLIDGNISNLQRIAFSKTLSLADFYLTDHRIGNAAVMPAAAYMEMAVQAGNIACNDKVRVLKNILWTKPLVVKDQPKSVSIALYPDADSIYFEIAREADNHKKTYCQGRLASGDIEYTDDTGIDIDAIRRRSTTLNGEQIDGLFAGMGFQFGPSFQVFKQLHCGKEEALALIELPATATESFILHPSLLDGILRTTVGIAPESYRGYLPLPVALERLEIYRPLNAACYVHAGLCKPHSDHSQVRHFDIRVFDLNGALLLKLQNFMTRPVQAPAGVAADDAQASAAVATGANAENLFATIESYLKRIVSDILKLAADQIESNRPLDEYGIDSTMIVSLNDTLEQTFGPLSKTLFFEYQDLQSLAGYFVEEHADKIATLQKAGGSAERHQAPVLRESSSSAGSLYDEIGFSPVDVDELTHSHAQAERHDDIAIVGISGRYPKAANLEEFYQNLRAGRNCVTEIPADRWDGDAYYDADRKQFGKSYSKWGGFLDHIDRFDPLFFNITPAEVVTIDPQERIFLETVWETLENAGYTKASLSESTVGVFAGTMWGHYELLGVQEGGGVQQKLPSSNYSSIANRISYFFNFRGPSIALDTMCSSSLTSIHLACESIRRGECNVAIAGGVNLNVHPHKYLLLSGFQFLSSDGTCRSFGEGGDGYVPGEGAGAVMLKSLRQAEADGDFIHGVIKGTGINHGGKVNGFYVPNPNAQGELIERVLSQNHIRAEQLSYIEAHGTGTALGDPIEISGLKQALSKTPRKQPPCSIGSVKSNIGHLEAAAGIAGITKILLQMNSGELFPSLHSAKLNPNLDMNGAPFYIQQSLQAWNNIADDPSATRLAGINSFGAGGSNAFIVLQEYKKHPVLQVQSAPQLVPLSAKTPAALKQYAERLADFVAAHSNGAVNHGLPLMLADLAFTLQTGREHMPERAAFVAGSLQQLQLQLQQFGRQQQAIDGAYTGSAGNQTATSTDGDLHAVARAWVGGAGVNFAALHRNGLSRRIPLPSYCFQYKRYWFTRSDVHSVRANPEPTVELPLIDRADAATDLRSGALFSKRLSASNPLVASHRFQGRPLLPAVAYLEMVAEALHGSGHAGPLRFNNVVWQAPLFIGDTASEIFLSLQQQADAIGFEIWTLVNQQRVVHGKGRVSALPVQTGHDRVDMQALEQQTIAGSDRIPFYDRFSRLSISYGRDFQAIDHIRYGERHAIARYAAPGGAQRYLHHPAVLDSALQAFLTLPSLNSQAMQFPFAVDAIELIRPLKAHGYALVSMNDNNRYQASIVDDNGGTCVRFHGVQFRQLPRAKPAPVLRKPAATDVHSNGGDRMLEDHIASLFSRVLQIDRQDLKADVSFDQYGLESVMAVNLSAELERDFGPLPATLLFEYQTIKSLCDYFLQHHRDRCMEKFATPPAAEPQRRMAAGTPVTEGLDGRTERYIKRIFSEFLQIDIAELGAQTRFENYGLESVMAVNISSRFEQDFGSLPATLLFEHQTIDSLVKYFTGEHRHVCELLFADEATDRDVSVGQYESSIDQMPVEKPFSGGFNQQRSGDRLDIRLAIDALSDEEVERLLGQLTEHA